MISIRSQSEIAFALFSSAALRLGCGWGAKPALPPPAAGAGAGACVSTCNSSDIYSHPEFLRDQSLSKTNESVRLTLAPTSVEKPAGAVATPPRPKLALTPTETLVPTVAGNMRNGLS